MSGMKYSVVVALLLAATSFARAEDPEAFREWLGPQTQDVSKLLGPILGERIDVSGSIDVNRRIDPNTDHKLRRYDLSLKIVKGSNLDLPASENPIVTFQENEFRQLEQFQPVQDAMYLVGRMQLQKGKRGWRFYTLNVHVNDGPLKGAVVHLRDGRLQNSIVDACIAVYEIPGDIEVNDGDVRFDVVAQFSK